jgi:hypothetical protein
MKLNIELNLGKELAFIEKYFNEEFINNVNSNTENNESLQINSEQLLNLATYLDIVKKNVVSDIIIGDIILQACNYDMDDNLNYWIILTKNLAFMDIAVPKNADVSNDKIFADMNKQEIEVVKELLELIE